MLRAAYHALVPYTVRRELWYRRMTGSGYRTALPVPCVIDIDVEYIAPCARVGISEAGQVAVIMVTMNNIQMTKLAIASVLNVTTYPDYRLIIVDNGSDIDLLSWLKALPEVYPWVTVIPNGCNLGFAAANNIGMRMADDCSTIVLLNNDTVVAAHWLSSLLIHLRDPEIGIICPTTNFTGNAARVAVPYRTVSAISSFAAKYTMNHAGMLIDLPVAMMFCAAFRRSIIYEIGTLDEQFSIGMFEDDDYSMRIQRQGYRVACARDSFVHHFGGATFSRLESSHFQQIFDENRRRFEQKWQCTWTPTRQQSA